MNDALTLELLECPPSGKAVERMTPKGHSPVDLQSADTATSRRSLIGALGAAGLVGAAALAVASPAAASPYTTTDTDRELLGRALQLELAARRLYQEAAESGLTDKAREVAQTFGGNHEAYADQMAAITGISANTYNEAAYEARVDSFTSGDATEFATAAWELENAAAATYTGLLNDFESIDAQSLIAAIVVVNGRMATVLADLAEVSNVSEVFSPSAELIDVTAGEET